MDPGATVAEHAQQVHWAYVVGGSPDVFRDVKRKLLRHGVNVSGWVRIDARGDSVKIPRGTTCVIASTDGSTHSITDAARAQADKLGLPLVAGPFMRWSELAQRLAAKGLLGQSPRSIFEGSTRHPAARTEDPRGTFAERLGEKGMRKVIEAVAGGELPAPEPPPAPAASPEPAPAPRVVFERKRAPSADAQARQDAARAILLACGGKVTNTEVRKRVHAKTGGKIMGHDALNRLRVELGFKPRGAGGVERDTLSRSALRTHRIAGEPLRMIPVEAAAPQAAEPPPAETLPRPQIAPPDPTPEARVSAPEAPQAVPQAPAPAGLLASLDLMDLVREMQARLTARGLWGVMVERSTVTFQSASGHA